MMTIDDDADYYRSRNQQSLAMSLAALDPAVRKIHLELARQYAALAGEAGDESVTILDPSGVFVLSQIATAARARQ